MNASQNKESSENSLKFNQKGEEEEDKKIKFSVRLLRSNRQIILNQKIDIKIRARLLRENIRLVASKFYLVLNKNSKLFKVEDLVQKWKSDQKIPTEVNLQPYIESLNDLLVTKKSDNFINANQVKFLLIILDDNNQNA